MAPSRSGRLSLFVIRYSSLRPEVASRDRQAAADAEGFWGDAQSGRRLAALVFAAVDRGEYFLDQVPRISPGGDFFHIQPFFHVGLDDRIKNLVRRQDVLIGLVRLQLR